VKKIAAGPWFRTKNYRHHINAWWTIKIPIFFFCAVIIANGRFFIVIRAAQVLVGRINQTYIKIIFIYLKKIKIMVLKTRGMPIKLDVN
jgi:hypothetical protein